jgi:aminomethyltransferase
MSFGLLRTAFHARTAEHNLSNAWVQRRAFSVPAHYGDPCQEVLAARVSAVLIDASAYEDVRVHGAGAAALLAAACGTALRELNTGRSLGVYWCADGGGVRGLGVVSRFSENDFILRSADADFGWFTAAAPRFNAVARDISSERGLIVLAGPFAAAVLDSAGFEEAAGLQDGQLVVHEWRGFGVTLWRDQGLDAYQLSCARDDAAALFDRLLRAGRSFGLYLAGQEAFEVLQLEAGMVLPGLDFAPVRQNFAREPLPSSLGLELTSSVESNSAARVLAGIELGRDEPCAFAPLFRENVEVGRTLRSAYSPALRRAIALAQLAPAQASAGTELLIRTTNTHVKGRVVTLPFL